MFVKLSLLLFPLLMSCTNFMYFPSKLVFDNPKRHNLIAENHYIISKDEVRLHAWLITSTNKIKSKKGLILQYHGNAENLTSHYLSLAWLAHHGYDVLIFDYRGYGSSEGVVDAKGVYLDSQAVLDYALQLKQEKKYEKFMVVGQSLGGSIALKTLSEIATNKSRDAIDLVILDSTFRSNSEVASRVLKKSWITYLFSPLAYVFMYDNYNASRKDLENWPYKTLCITHPLDPVVPSILTVNLFNEIGEKSRKWLWLRDDIYGGHVSAFFTPNGPLNQKLLDFLAKELHP
jgi:predicted alpha/beta-fold hydrolase